MSALCWAVYTVFGRGVVRRHGGLPTTTISMVLGGLFFLVACLVMGKGLLLGWRGALTGLFLALVPTVFGFTAWYVALEKLPANVLGPLQFIVRKRWYNLLDEVRLDRDLISKQNATAGLELTDHEGNVYRASNDPDVSVVVEETGPVRTRSARRAGTSRMARRANSSVRSCPQTGCASTTPASPHTLASPT